MIKIIYLIFFFSILLTVVSANEKFLLSSLDEAHNLSRQTKKPILLIFGGDYCAHCAKLKDDILSKDFENIIDKYIVCYIDVQENPNLKRKYKVSTVPDSRIINDADTISSIIGYSKSAYQKWLNNDY